MEISESTFNQPAEKTKFCKHCGATIAYDAVVCTACGRQVEELKGTVAQPQVVINNSNESKNTNVNANVNANGATGGLFIVGVVIDFIAILAKPNPYYVI